jgi:hypothetical protein
MIKIEVTKNEYEQICSALHYASFGEWKPEKYYENKYDFAGVRTKLTKQHQYEGAPQPPIAARLKDKK